GYSDGRESGSMAVAADDQEQARRKLCEVLARARFGVTCRVQSCVFGPNDVGACWLERDDGHVLWVVTGETEREAIREMERSLVAKPIPLRDVAERLRITTRRARQLAEAGRLPAFRAG